MASITESGSRKYSGRVDRPWGRFGAVISGLAFLAFGTFLIAALTSHDPGDPSWNQAIDAPVRNLMGTGGARLSDVLLQWLGFAAWLLPLMLLDWAVRCIGGRGLRRLWLKLILAAPLLVAGALAISILPAPAGWPLKAGLGGVIGKLGRDGFAHISVAPPLSAMAAAVLVALLLLYWIGLPALSLMPRPAAAKKHYVRPQSRLRAAQVEDDEDAIDDDEIDDEDAPAKPSLLARARALIPSWPRKTASGEDGVVMRQRREPSLGGIVDDDEDEIEDIKLPPARRSAVSVDMPRRPKKREQQRQSSLDLGHAGEHLLPPLEMLE